MRERLHSGQYLKNFDEPAFYQELNNPKGTVLITEMDNIEGEIMTGFVAPMIKKEE